MFKNGVTLKKNSWYIKLLNIMWGANYTDFKNLCPLFWSTIGSIVLFPLWIIGISFKYLLKLGGKFKWSNKLMYYLIIIGKLFWGFITSVFISVSLFTLISCLCYLVIKKDLLLDSIIAISAFIALLFIIYYTIGGIMALFDKVFSEDSNSILRTNKYIYVPLKYTLGGLLSPLYILLKVSEFILNIFKYIKKLIVSLYKRSCPLIKWI